MADINDMEEDKLNIDGEWVNAPSVGKEDEAWNDEDDDSTEEG